MKIKIDMIFGMLFIINFEFMFIIWYKLSLGYVLII